MVRQEIAKTLREMMPGQLATFPIEREQSVRNTCTRISIETGALYKCTRQRAKRVVEVTRIRRPRKARQNSVEA